jgi:transposase-like protein
MDKPSSEIDPLGRPDKCPFCNSRAVGTLAKVITTATHWRCQSCGESWNPARLDASRRPNPPR